MEDIEYGTIRIKLADILKEQNISINKLAFRAEMQRFQIRNYCRNDIQRLDIAILSRLCYALNCDLTDLLEYIPPQSKKL